MTGVVVVGQSNRTQIGKTRSFNSTHRWLELQGDCVLRHRLRLFSLAPYQSA
jgi:hypothetical protein